MVARTSLSSKLNFKWHSFFKRNAKLNYVKDQKNPHSRAEGGEKEGLDTNPKLKSVSGDPSRMFQKYFLQRIHAFALFSSVVMVISLGIYLSNDVWKLKQLGALQSRRRADNDDLESSFQKSPYAKVTDRLAPYRPNPPHDFSERLDRALRRNLLLIDSKSRTAVHKTFWVQGTSGGVQTIDVSSFPKCTCHDFQRGQLPCRHLLYVYLKVLGLSPNSPLIYQKALLHRELTKMFSSLPLLSYETCDSTQMRERSRSRPSARSHLHNVIKKAFHHTSQVQDVYRGYQSGFSSPGYQNGFVSPNAQSATSTPGPPSFGKVVRMSCT
eukprot:jgi/Bigna1/145760/aug1.103_g20468